MHRFTIIAALGAGIALAGVDAGPAGAQTLIVRQTVGGGSGGSQDASGAAAIDFVATGPQNLDYVGGADNALTLNVLNAGDSAGTLGAITLAPTTSYRLAGGSCRAGLRLQPAASCTITVAALAAANGPLTDATLSLDPGDGPVRQRVLQGTASGIGAYHVAALGSGSACSEAAPCSLSEAISQAGASPGTITLTGDIAITGTITLPEGAILQSPPGETWRLSSTYEFFEGVVNLSKNSRLQDIAIESQNTGSSVRLPAGDIGTIILDRVTLENTRTDNGAVLHHAGDFHGTLIVSGSTLISASETTRAINLDVIGTDDPQPGEATTTVTLTGSILRTQSVGLQIRTVAPANPSGIDQRLAINLIGNTALETLADETENSTSTLLDLERRAGSPDVSLTVTDNASVKAGGRYYAAFDIDHQGDGLIEMALHNNRLGASGHLVYVTADEPDARVILSATGNTAYRLPNTGSRQPFSFFLRNAPEVRIAIRDTHFESWAGNVTYEDLLSLNQDSGHSCLELTGTTIQPWNEMDQTGLAPFRQVYLQYADGDLIEIAQSMEELRTLNGLTQDPFGIDGAPIFFSTQCTLDLGG